ncbi:MAG: quinone-dependent dihydroorotate dehydrogenase [Dehalococcoidia bacterium]
MVYDLIRPVLFRLSGDDPERAHEWAMHALATAGRLAGSRQVPGLSEQNPRLQTEVAGLTFPNPVGVAAGFDKNAVALPALAALGFGFIEAGTVTFRPQSGNPRPRIVRLPERGALINRMGFNNDGAAVVARRLGRTGSAPVPIGISLGKSRITPLEDAVEDYRASYRLLAPHAGYVAVNVSSPNTPGLRTLQERAPIAALLAALQAEGAVLQSRTGARPPLFVKLAPDLTDDALDELIDVCLAHQIDGLIAVNTTTARYDMAVTFEGGLSGRPLLPRALEVVRFIDRATKGRLPIIGVGGIFNAGDAYAMIRAGASAVQVYTGLIYEGPTIARRINRGLLRLMDRDGVPSLRELIQEIPTTSAVAK